MTKAILPTKKGTTQKIAKTPYQPLTKEEIAGQKKELEWGLYEQMLRKEFSSRLGQDYFQWQTKVDKLMRVTLMCWMGELCTEMRF